MKRILLNQTLPKIIQELSKKYIISDNDVDHLRFIINQLDDNISHENAVKSIFSTFFKTKKISVNNFRENQIKTIGHSESQYKFISNSNEDGKYEEDKNLTINSLLGPKNLSETMIGRNFFLTHDALSIAHKKLLFDTRNKISDISWDLVSYKTNATNRGQVVINGFLQQIVSIECLPFLFPIPHNSPDIISGKIYMGIDEFKSQATINSINEAKNKTTHYIFSFTSSQVGNFLLLKPDFKWKPTDVITETTKITPKFYTAYGEINLDEDRFYASVSATNPAIITTQTPHYLSTGDVVYLSNSQEQNFYVSVLSATTFNIPLNSTSAFNTELFLSGKSLRFELIFGCLEK